MHDTEIVVPSRDDNCSIGQSTVICTGDPFFGLIGSGLIGQLIEKSDLRLWALIRVQPPLRLWALIRVQPFLFCSGKQNWGSLSGDCQRGKFAPSSEWGTVSNHIEKIRCLNAP